MRSRRASDSPRRRATPKQEAKRLLRSLDHNASCASAAAGNPISAPTKGKEGKGLRRVTLAATAEANAQAAIPSPRPRRPAANSPSAAAAKGERGKAASLTTAQLLQHLQLTSFVDRVTERVKAWASSLAEWAQPAFDPALRGWERQLSLSLRKDSFADCTAVQNAMQQRYEDQFGHNHNDVAFLTLYARVLVNNAIFCLVSFETYRSTQLLQEAVHVAKEAHVLQRRLAQGQEDGATAAAQGKARGETGTSTAAAAANASKQPSLVGDPECHLLLLRVLLANAYASDQQYWKAAEQYQLALSAMERNPMWCPEQVAPGLASPLPFNHTLVTEDAKLFYEDSVRVAHAISQGRAHLLLLQSKGPTATSARLLQVQLAMARLHRHAGQYAESQNLYESYLDGVTEHVESEDVGGAMLELGRLLLYKVNNSDAAVIYLEAASSILLEDAEALLQVAEAHGGSSGSSRSNEATAAEARIAAGNATHRAAGGLIDAAMAFHTVGKTGQAIGLLEGCLQLLDRADLGSISGWVRRQYADMLASVALVDRALEEYSRTIELLRNGCGAVAQLGTAGEMVPLNFAEVEGHMAFCLQTYVGDHKRAMKHYRNIVKGPHKKDASVTSAQVRLNKRARRQRASATAVAATAAGSTRVSDGVAFTSDQANAGSSPAPPRVDVSLQPDVMHWVLSNYVACCERVGAYAEAVGVQSRLIEIEGALGGGVVDSYLKLISLARQAGDMEKTLALCFYIFFLPDDMMPSETRLSVANSFASCCHRLGNSRMGSVLLQAVQQVRGDHDASSLARYAMGLKTLDPSDCVQLDCVDIEANIDTIGRVFRRAASIVVADMVVNGVEDEERISRDGRRASNSDSSAAAAALSDGGNESSVPSLASPSLWTLERVDRTLNSLIVLSRGAFFFHQNRFIKDAEELYAVALQHVDHIIASMPVLTERHQREMGILLVNYATLKSATDPELAATLYERAAAVCPTYLEVAEVVADVFVQSGDYAKGSVYMKRVMRANPSAATEMHMRLARIGTGSAWDTMSHGQRMEVMEHLLKGLGVAPERVAAALAAGVQSELTNTNNANVVMSLGNLAPLLLDGVATATSEDAVCFATYVVQTRFQEPQLLNRMYRRALLRFPQHATILVNYATLCMHSGCHTLARKYIAKAYAASSGDSNCTMCYAHYLCRSFDDRQVGCGEALYAHFLERYPNAAQAHAAFANYMAGVMPTPFKTEQHFKAALELAPPSEDVLLQYGQFMWACTDSKTVYTNDEVRRRVFDRAEQLFKEAVAINPNSFTACHQLGTFYANGQYRFEDAMTMLQRAHMLQPGNIEVVRHILGVLHGECMRLKKEELRRGSTVALQGTNTQSFSGQLRSLVDATKEMFEHVLGMDPNDEATLEGYARFAVETLQDPKLAATIYRRIEELNRR
ncbi:conserved hypothetical protein [Leishmania major strain Friedlin]|uniref:Uncharacterized protein n=1 Tax=Leishmania major TaxID=5664 RepID=E9AD86_LEIMA|nr:conserved hypothetical protein [Leishmania major strain Friedlin]CAG9576711.1 hypothetical_protein_-_conserved [Leishmania major strain Friedlin]CBZ12171.1 conserved hypothetical protein [Leishmania major strain Friedlin]|eukprot:XP_003721915.1 conserved hypothetical protein [Leishmania major strain Friedlin]